MRGKEEKREETKKLRPRLRMGRMTIAGSNGKVLHCDRVIHNCYTAPGKRKKGTYCCPVRALAAGSPMGSSYLNRVRTQGSRKNRNVNEERKRKRRGTLTR